MIEQIKALMNTEFLENPIWRYFVFAGIILVGIIFKRLLAKAIGYIIFKVFKKKAQEIGVKEFYKLTRKPLGYFLLLIFVYFACDQLKLPEAWHLVPRDQFGWRMVLFSTFETLLIITIIWLGLKIIDFIGLILISRAAKDDDPMNDQFVAFAKDILKIIVLVLGIFIILGTVFQINIGSLIAGLGIGGLAIALAAKETLENLFGSLTIFMDKPFIAGDWIKIGDTEGIVEKIGIRSTRVRTFEKSYVTIPNKRMIDAELDNMTLRTAMRSKFFVGILYNTPAPAIKQIIKDIESYLQSNEMTNENYKVNLTDFGASSLNIMVLYYVKTDDWSIYMNMKEQVNFQIIDIVHNNGSDFAFPSTSLYIEKK